MPNLNNVEGCTLSTCPIEWANVRYDPTLAGNALYLGVFSLLFFTQIYQLWRYRTWSFSFAMLMGLVLEVVGYVGRVQMHFNPFLANPFLIYLICLTIGPVFFAAAIYLTLTRIIVHYGTQHARISPKAVSLTFMGCDFVALVLQATGGAIADTAPTRSGSLAGTHIMVAGLAFQTLTLLMFIAVAMDFAWNVIRDRRAGRASSSESSKDRHETGQAGRFFKVFLGALAYATLCILARSSFRVGELAKGFGSKLANEEIPFMVLEGAMVVLATSVLTIFHPGIVFGEKWKDAGWTWKNSRSGTDIEGDGIWEQQPEAVAVEENK